MKELRSYFSFIAIFCALFLFLMSYLMVSELGLDNNTEDLVHILLVVFAVGMMLFSFLAGYLIRSEEYEKADDENKNPNRSS